MCVWGGGLVYGGCVTEEGGGGYRVCHLEQ